MIQTLSIAAAAIVLVVGGWSAWQTRRRRAAVEALRLSSGWRRLADPRGAIHPSVWDLTAMNLGYNRVLDAAVAVSPAGRERTLVEARFDSGFGERRRHYRFSAEVSELPGAPRVLVITRDPIISAAAMRPGFVTRHLNGLDWIADSAVELESICPRLSSWLEDGPEARTVEFRTGIVAIFEPGEMTGERQAALNDATDWLLITLQSSTS